MHRLFALLGLGLALTLFLLLAPGLAGRPRPTPPPAAAHAVPGAGRALDLGHLPLAFAPQPGPAHAPARFQAQTPAGTLFFTPAAVVLALNTAGPRPQDSTRTHSALRTFNSGLKEAAPPAPAQVRLQWLGANPAPVLTGASPLAGRVNYFVGDDPAQWQTDLPTYSLLLYQELYPGISLRYGGTAGALKGTYTLAPGADPGAIRWRYQGVGPGTLDAAGNLHLPLASTAAGSPPPALVEQAPVAWQERAGQRAPVAIRYALGADGSIGFALGAYDRRRPLTIDPTLIYATYFGGSADDYGFAAALDAAGDLYITGSTTSADFPLVAPFQANCASGCDYAFVTKLDSTGTVLYSTYLGGDSFNQGLGIVVDAGGNAYVTGGTQSTNFPLMNPYQSTNRTGFTTAFVTKLSPTGAALVYSTYLGGSILEQGLHIAVDGTGAAYVAGYTESRDFPVLNAVQPSHGGDIDAFVTKFMPSGTALSYSTYLGGSDQEYPTGLAIDAVGSVYLAGETSSPDFPVRHAYQGVLKGPGDAFVTRLNASGSAFVYSTYLGGSGRDGAGGLAVDAAGNVYVAGATTSTDFPLVHPYQRVYAGGGQDGDVFVAKLNATGAALLYSTYLGGSGDDFTSAIGVDGAGNAYVTGLTLSTNFPLAAPIQSTLAGGYDVFVTQFQATGATLGYSTYLGGSGDDDVRGLAVDAAGTVYLVGGTRSTNFPVTADAFQTTLLGTTDAFIARIDPRVLTPTPTVTGTPPTPLPTRTLWPRSTSTPTATPSPSPTPPCPEAHFVDVCVDAWYYPPVTDLVTLGAISGYTCGTPGEPCDPQNRPYFRPYADITRGQLTKAAIVAFAIPVSATEQLFADVPPDNAFYPYINTAFTLNIVGGYTCGGPGEPCDSQNRPYFRPYASITRGQASKIITLAQGWGVLTPPEASFEDVPASQPFYSYIETIRAAGTISGYDCGGPGEPCDATNRPYFRPGNNITRAQAAKILDLARTQAPPTPTPAATQTAAPALTATATPLPATASATPTSTSTAAVSTVTPTAGAKAGPPHP